MNKEEKEARKICAWCNFVAKCEDCPHREWPSGKWHKKPRWDYKKCKEWRYYLKKPHEKLIRKIRKLIGWHKWFKEVEYDPVRIVRICTICKEKQEYKGKQWIKIG